MARGTYVRYYNLIDDRLLFKIRLQAYPKSDTNQQRIILSGCNRRFFDRRTVGVGGGAIVKRVCKGKIDYFKVSASEDWCFKEPTSLEVCDAYAMKCEYDKRRTL